MRSNLEESINAKLNSLGLKFKYECKDSILPYVVPEKKLNYWPDDTFPNGILIEIKGKFSKEDQQKMKRVREQHPDKDIRFVFDTNKTIVKGGKMRYSRWCELKGFPHFCFVRPGNMAPWQTRPWYEIVEDWYNEN